MAKGMNIFLLLAFGLLLAGTVFAQEDEDESAGEEEEDEIYEDKEEDEENEINDEDEEDNRDARQSYDEGNLNRNDKGAYYLDEDTARDARQTIPNGGGCFRNGASGHCQGGYYCCYRPGARSGTCTHRYNRC